MTNGDDPDTGILPLFDHTHDRGTTALVVAATGLLALYAAWVAADFGARTATFVVAAVALGFLLYGQPSRRAVAAAALYSAGALVALTPLLYELLVVTAASDPLAHLLTFVDLVFLLAFWLIAAIPVLAASRLAGGPILPRIRSRLG